MAKKELADLGIEALPNNLEAFISQKNLQQHPVGYEDLLASIKDPYILKSLMKEKGIKSIIHSEGLTLWDHVKLSIQEIDLLDVPYEDKKDLKLIMFYHDM